MDLAAANTNDGTVTVLLGTGLGSFTVFDTYDAGNTPYMVTAADIKRN